MEVARTVLKGVLDELEKYREVRELQNAIMEELRRLVGEQRELAASTRDPQTALEQAKSAQTALEADTSALLGLFNRLLERLRELQGTAQEGNPYTQARSHVSGALASQGGAITELGRSHRAEAAALQEESLRELEQALDILTPPPGQDRQEQGQSEQQDKEQPQNQGQQEGEGRDSSTPEESQAGARAEGAGSAPQGEGSDATRPSSQGTQGMQSVEDILREEEENRESREAVLFGGASAVDRDW
jgi:hypothetical protein